MLRLRGVHLHPDGDGGAPAGGAPAGGAPAGGAPAGGEDVAGLKAKVAELLGANKKFGEQLKAFEGLDPEAARKALKSAEESETERARKAGEFDKLQLQLVDKHKGELGTKDAEIQKLSKGLYGALAKTQIMGALTGKDGQPIGNITLLQPHLQPFVKVVPNPNASGDDDAFVTQVVDKAGQVRVKDGQGTPFTIADLIEEFRGKDEYAGAFYAPDASGGGARGNGGAKGGTGTAYRISKTDALDATKYQAAKAEAKKRGVPLEISE